LPASRQIGELVTQGSRRVCIFRRYCAAHVSLSRSVALKSSTLPTHANTSGQVHVPRLWEVTGRADSDRRRAVREWNSAHKQRTESANR
jgi:hypothetical protein